MFEFNADEQRLEALHHPFTAPALPPGFVPVGFVRVGGRQLEQRCRVCRAFAERLSGGGGDECIGAQRGAAKD